MFSGKGSKLWTRSLQFNWAYSSGEIWGITSVDPSHFRQVWGSWSVTPNLWFLPAIRKDVGNIWIILTGAYQTPWVLVHSEISIIEQFLLHRVGKGYINLTVANISVAVAQGMWTWRGSIGICHRKAWYHKNEQQAVSKQESKPLTKCLPCSLRHECPPQVPNQSGKPLRHKPEAHGRSTGADWEDTAGR